MRLPDATYRNAQSRRTTDRWILDTEPLSGETNRTPAIEITTSHVKERKAITVRLAYIELENQPGYSITHWQSDWPAAILINQPIARYSAVALANVRREAFEGINLGTFAHATVTWAVDKITGFTTAA